MTNINEMRRYALAPYVKKRLKFEGVLIKMINRKIKQKSVYDLTFVSVYAINEKIELDHVVIRITSHQMNKMTLMLYKRYTFTAKVNAYTKQGNVYGRPAQIRQYSLIEIDKTQITSTSHINHQTQHVQKQIEKIKRQYNNAEFEHAIKNIKNDGSIEKLIDEYFSKQKKVTRTDIHQKLYKNQ